MQLEIYPSTHRLGRWDIWSDDTEKWLVVCATREEIALAVLKELRVIDDLFIKREESIARTYTLYNNGVVHATGMTLDIAQHMQSLYPDRITYAPTKAEFFKYDICFSTPLMNTQSAHELISRAVDGTLFPAYTVYDGAGSWQGSPEPSYTFTCTQEQDDAAITTLAETFKDVFKQDAVLIIKTPVTAWLI